MVTWYSLIPALFFLVAGSFAIGTGDAKRRIAINEKNYAGQMWATFLICIGIASFFAATVELMYRLSIIPM